MFLTVRYTSFSILVALFSLLVPAGVDPRAKEIEPDIKAVQQVVSRMLHAVYSGDTETVIIHTHPVVVRSLGGLRKARQKMMPTLQNIARQGLKIRSLEFPTRPNFFQAGKSLYVVVPTHTVVESGNGTLVASQNFQIGIRDLGSGVWKFVEGSRVTPQNLQIFFPGFPADFKFPPISRKRL